MVGKFIRGKVFLSFLSSHIPKNEGKRGEIGGNGVGMRGNGGTTVWENGGNGDRGV